MSQLATLFDLEPTTRHARQCCEGTCDTHALMPNMAYACGETILTIGGHFEIGTNNYTAVTCTDCRAQGIERIRWRTRRQQDRCVLCCSPAIGDAAWCAGCEVRA